MLGRYTTGPRPAESSTKPAGAHASRDRWPTARRPSRPPRAILPAMPRIDLRSDTVTHPTPAMRRAMAAAEVGDDVFGDDPTVNALEERAAELLGKEAGLFVASGTMGNLVAQMAHLARGEEVIAAATSHLVMDEAAGHAVVVGASVRTLAEDAGRDDRPGGHRGGLPRPGRRPRADHAASSPSRTRTPTRWAARSPSPTRRRSRRSPAGTASRSTSTGPASSTPSWPSASPRPPSPPPPTRSRSASRKGLACPVGSVVVGTHDFIRRARRARKLLGGGMRQVGVLAAPGLRRPLRRPGRDDRAPRRGPRQRAPPGRGPGRARGDRVRRRDRPADAGPPGPRARRDELRHLPRRPRPGRVPGRARGPRRPDGPLPARHHPRRDPLRHRARRRRGHDRRRPRGPRRDRGDAPALPARMPAPPPGAWTTPAPVGAPHA